MASKSSRCNHCTHCCVRMANPQRCHQAGVWLKLHHAGTSARRASTINERGSIAPLLGALAANAAGIAIDLDIFAGLESQMPLAHARVGVNDHFALAERLDLTVLPAILYPLKPWRSSAPHP